MAAGLLFLAVRGSDWHSMGVQWTCPAACCPVGAMGDGLSAMACCALQACMSISIQKWHLLQAYIAK